MLTVIIPTHGPEPNLARLRACLSRQRVPVEVLVVDTQSPKGTALNQGVERAAGSILLFLDADVLLSDRILPEAIGLLENGFALVTAKRRYSRPCWSMLGEELMLGPRRLKFPGAWFLLARKETVVRLGGWRDHPVEDFEFWLRAREAGLRIGYCQNRVFSTRPVKREALKFFWSLRLALS